MKYLYISKFYFLVDRVDMVWVDRRRADIDVLVRKSREYASQRRKRIDSIDPVLKCAKSLFPYLPDRAIHEYSRTALRLILNEPENVVDDHQTTLMNHFMNAQPAGEY